MPAIRGAGTPEAAWSATALDTLRGVEVGQLIGDAQRVVVVAPHPDDEIIGAGGLLATLASTGFPQDRMLVVGVTDGGGSHPGSQAWPVRRLIDERVRERRRGLRRLGLAAVDVTRLALGDGALHWRRQMLGRSLSRVIRGGDMVISTWRHDGHPDHDQTGASAAAACAAAGARLVEVPIWMWHWARPHDRRVPWQRLVRVALSPDSVRAKRHALRSHRTQIEVDPTTQRPAILPRSLWARTRRDWEAFIV